LREEDATRTSLRRKKYENLKRQSKEIRKKKRKNRGKIQNKKSDQFLRRAPLRPLMTDNKGVRCGVGVVLVRR
jgi:hypothetical protein